MSENVRLATLTVTLLAGAAAGLGLVRGGPRSGPGDDSTSLQALELRVEEDGETHVVCVPAPITIGRAPTATLAIADRRVSRMHARIELVEGEVCVRDLGSRNGTLLNARPLDGPVALVPGDEIDVGTSRITYEGLRPWT